MLDKSKLENAHGAKFEVEQIKALIEIREAIEEGFKRIDQTNIEAALMLVGCKETLDAFLDARLRADKVLAGVEELVRAETAQKAAEEVEKATEAPPEPEKSAVTIDVGDFGQLDSGSGKA